MVGLGLGADQGGGGAGCRIEVWGVSGPEV